MGAIKKLARLHPAVLALLLSLSLTGCPPMGPSGGGEPTPIIVTGNFIDQTYVAIDPANHDFLISNSEANIIQAFSSTGGFVAGGAGQSGDNSSANGRFAWPAGIAIDPTSRNLVVADSQNNRIQILAPSGETWSYSSKFGSLGSHPGQFNLPYNVAIDPVSHNIVVADSGNNRLQMFTATGGYIGQFGGKGSGAGQFVNPQGLAIDQSSRNIIVGDGGNSRVQVFDLNGNHLFSFGSKGADNGQFSGQMPPTGDPVNFNSPMGVAVDPNTHNILVSDGGNSRVEIFSSAGQFLSAFGSRGTAPGQFNTPVGVAVDSASCNTIVVDYANNRAEIFPPTAQAAQLPSAISEPPTIYDPTVLNHLMHGVVSTGSCGQIGNSPTTVTFQYSVAPYAPNPPASYPYSVTATPNVIPAGTTNQQVTAIFHIVCNVMGHYRVVATNNAGTTYGADQLVVTPSCE
jgi:DNA-binding beta-propeller fold protein YncE